MTKMITDIILLLQGIFLISISPLLSGWIKKIKSWMQMKKAPAITQPYATLRKLLIKTPVTAHNASWLFRLVPYAYFSLLCLASFCLPFYMTHTLFENNVDIIVFVGILTFARFLLILGAMDIGNAFGSLGARRDLFIACCAEPILFIALFNVATLSHSAYFTQSAEYFIHHFALFPGLLFSLLALLFVLFAETGRIPIDNPATHLELTMVHEALILEYSGRYLALIEWGRAVHLVIYISIINTLFFPYGLSSIFSTKDIGVSILITLIKLFSFAAFIAFFESLRCRMRFFRIPDYFAIAFTLSILGILVTQLLGSTS